jgi:hypothetical protein
MPAGTGFRKRIRLPLLLILVFGCVSVAISAQEKEKQEPKFRWSFCAIHGSSQAPKIEPVTRNLVLKSGDKLKMMIELRRKCFVYLIHRGSQGNVTLLFPYTLKQFDADYRQDTRYYVPKGDAWFQLDDKAGKETFYLLASDQRLLDIEYAYDRYVASDVSKKEDLAGQILARIDDVHRQTLAAARPEKMLAKTDTPVRGFERATGADPTDIAGLAREISFENVYSETIVIEHRDAGAEGTQEK